MVMDRFDFSPLFRSTIGFDRLIRLVDGSTRVGSQAAHDQDRHDDRDCATSVDGAKGGLIGTSNATVRTSKRPQNLGAFPFSSSTARRGPLLTGEQASHPAQHSIGSALSKASA